MRYQYLRNPNVFAVHCKQLDGGISVGILACKTNAVFGTEQRLYSESGLAFDVQIPTIPQEYDEVLPYARVATV